MGLPCCLYFKLVASAMDNKLRSENLIFILMKLKCLLLFVYLEWKAMSAFVCTTGWIVCGVEVLCLWAEAQFGYRKRRYLLQSSCIILELTVLDWSYAFIIHTNFTGVYKKDEILGSMLLLFLVLFSTNWILWANDTSKGKQKLSSLIFCQQRMMTACVKFVNWNVQSTI